MGSRPSYWMSPVSGESGLTGLDITKAMFNRDPPYFCWGRHTHGTIGPADMLCVYITKKGGLGGVVAHGSVMSIEWSILAHDLLLLRTLKDTGNLSKQMMPLAELIGEIENDPHARKYPRAFLLGSLRRYYCDPVVVDDSLLKDLDVYRDGTVKNVGMLVRVTRSFSKHDFRLLTRGDV